MNWFKATGLPLRLKNPDPLAAKPKRANVLFVGLPDKTDELHEFVRKHLIQLSIIIPSQLSKEEKLFALNRADILRVSHPKVPLSFGTTNNLSGLNSQSIDWVGISLKDTGYRQFFMAEAKRVAKPDAPVVIWTYSQSDPGNFEGSGIAALHPVELCVYQGIYRKAPSRAKKL